MEELYCNHQYPPASYYKGNELIQYPAGVTG